MNGTAALFRRGHESCERCSGRMRQYWAFSARVYPRQFHVPAWRGDYLRFCWVNSECLATQQMGNVSFKSHGVAHEKAA